MGKMGPGMFFELAPGKHINSQVYRDQVLTGPLQDFWFEAYGDLEDNAPPHKKVCIPVRKALGIVYHKHPPNSRDLKPIENIWCHIKKIIARDYADITSRGEMMRVVQNLRDNYVDDKWNVFIVSMPERMEAVIAAKGVSTKY